MLHLILTLLLSHTAAPVYGLSVSVLTADADSVFYADLSDTVQVDVSIDSDGESITGFELFLAYDPSLFRPIDTDTSSLGNQPGQSAESFSQVFADSILIKDGNTSVVHFAEVDLIGEAVSAKVFHVRFLMIGRVSGASSIRVLQESGFSSLYTPADRDGETEVIPAGAGVTYQDLPPVLSGLNSFTIEEDGGPAFLVSDIVSDEAGVGAVDVVVTFSDASAGGTVDGDSLRFSTAMDFVGQLEGSLLVRDPAGGEASTAITLTTVAVNDEPVIYPASYPDTMAIGLEPVDVALVGTDVDDDPADLLWLALVGTDSLSADIADTTLTLTALDGWNGSTQLTLQLTDPGGLVAFLSVTVVSNAIPADFDGNGSVDFADFLLFAGAFQNPDADPKFDLDGSGVVDFPDFLIFVEGFGK